MIGAYCHGCTGARSGALNCGSTEPSGSLHSAAQGVITIVRGAVPLALFGAEGYGAVLGMLATPFVIVNATAPAIFALVVDRWGWPAGEWTLLGTCATSWIAMELMARWYARARRA